MDPNDNDIVYDSYGVDFTPMFSALYDLITGSDMSGASIVETLNSLWTIWSVIAFILSFLFIYGIIYSYLKLNAYGAMVSERLAREHQEWLVRYGGAATKHSRFDEVQAHVSSERPNDWRLAIIEADILLGEALTKQGYAGSSIGEQLKSISPTQLTTVQDAWDAHLVRNKIAHEGADYVLTQKAAQEAVVKYERSLRELGAL